MERKFIYAAVLVAVLTVIVFLPALRNGFVNWDDHDYIRDAPEIRSLDSRLLVFAFTNTSTANWHPLTWISYALDYRLWGDDPRGYHLQNILLHGLNTLLVILLIYRFSLSAPGPQPGPPSFLAREPAIALAAGLLFALHPLRVESVAWVSERKDVLCAFFFLTSLLVYYSGSRERKTYSARYFLSLFLFLFALMAKPMAVTLPLVILLLDVVLLGRPLLANWQARIPYFALSLFDAAVTLGAQTQAGALREHAHLSLLEKITNAVNACAFYLWKTAYPARLSPLYPYAGETTTFNTRLLASCAVLAALTVWCVWAWKRGRRAALAAWGSCLVILVPVLGVVSFGEQAAADRYTYLPGIGLSVLAAGAGFSGIRFLEKNIRTPRVVPLVSLLLVLSVTGLLSLMTIRQIPVWQDSESLWTRVVAEYPRASPTPYVGLGYDLLVKKAYHEAYAYCSEGLSLNRNNVPARECRAEALVRLGRYDEAVSDYGDLLQKDPRNTEALNGRGAAYLRKKRYTLAESDFRMVLSMDPSFNTAKYNLACLFAIQNKKAEACSWLMQAVTSGFGDFEQVQNDPDFANIRNELCYRHLVATAAAK